jgi:hypothetical protein
MKMTVKCLGIAAFAAMLVFVLIACKEPEAPKAKDSIINIATIQGVTIPVTGATPVRAITENAQYSGTVTWSGSPSSFAAETQYIATIMLTAKKGYTMQGVRANFFTVAGTTSVSNSANSGVITAVFPKTSASLPALTGTVIITGSANVGQTLTANTGSLNASGTFSYQWKRGNTNIGSNSSSYQVQSADIGSTIIVTVTCSGYSGSVTSAPTDIVIVETPSTPGLSYALINGNTAYSVSRGTATATEVIIPALYEGKPVTMIADNGFSSYTNMTSIKIPDRITSIGNYAFSNCASLTSVNIPSSVTTIGSNAFTGCTGLTSITIPFFGATLNGGYPFGYLFGTSSASTQNTFIPPSLKTVIIEGGNSVPANAFSGCTNITSITIPSSVLSIGANAFSGCTSLPSITIPSSVLSIGANAFSGCTSLPSITIPSSVTSIGNSTFSNWTGLTNITIPSSVTSIGQSAFSGCTSLPSIVIPDSVTSIGNSAFRNCTSLKSITLPFVGKSKDAATYEAVLGYIFDEYTMSLSTESNGSYFEVYTSSGSTTYYRNYSYNIPTSLKEVIITGSDIKEFAFSNCTGLTSVTIPNGVTSIGSFSFLNCTGLTSVTIPNGVTRIGEAAFRGCSGLTSVTIPNGVTSIGEAAFRGCSGLTSVNFNATTLADLRSYGYVFDNAGQNAGGIMLNIGANVTKIPACLFYVSVFDSSGTPPKITAVNFAVGSVCQSIGEFAFYNCSGLTSVTIPDSVTSIGEFAFYNCSGLTSVTIPDSVTSIDYLAFSGCSGLTSITFQGTIVSANFGTGDTFPGDLRTKFYATNTTNGTPGTYTRASGGSTWTKM